MDLFRKLFLSFICFLPTITLADANVLMGLDFGGAIPTNAGHSASFPLGYSTFSYSSNNYNDQASIIAS